MDELPDLPEFRMMHPVVGGTLRRMTSTPFTGRALNASGGGVPSASSSSRRLIATEDSSSSGLSGLNFGPYRSPSSSPPIHQLLPDKNLATEDSRLLALAGSPPLLASAQRSIPSSPPGVASSTSAGSGSSQNAGLIRGARKMQSTPSLSQLSRQGSAHRFQRQHEVDAEYLQDQLRPNHGGSMAMNSSFTESSPRSEEDEEPEEDVSDEDELEGEEDEEAVDISHYALSPWATAPAAPSALPTRASRTMVRGGGIEKSQEQHGRDLTRSMGTTVDKAQIKEKEEEGGDSAMAVDTEGAVDAIGEISDAPRHLARDSGAIVIITNETATATTVSEEISGNSREGIVVGGVSPSSVDAAAKGFNSMVIGSHSREDSRGQAAVEHHKVEGGEVDMCTKTDSGAVRGQG
ncbi:hypothetical protein EDD21DRAFT_374752 [Dissophora ornata]|nr:hypothetical protein EDD21DRAFT_374752 [Dissophora ornata]